MKIYCKNKHWNINKDYDTNKMLYILIDRPNHVDVWNSFYWTNKKGQCHREYNLPAFINNKGYVEWCKNGQYYRNDNKPARIFYDGYEQYYTNDKIIKEEIK